MSEFKFTRPNAFPPLVKNLIIINVLVFIAQSTLGERYPINDWFALHEVRSAFFQPHQIITFLFMHGSLSHLFLNMLALWMFGAQLENYWGPKRFFIFYLVCGIGSALLHLAVLYVELNPYYASLPSLPLEDQFYYINTAVLPLNSVTVGASGAIFGCLAAYGYLFPNTIINLYFAIPIKAKWFVIGYAALELYAGIRNSAGDTTAHFAHLGGALAGIILVIIWNKTNRKTFY
ncbi:MAG: rhomboid family intramembrane serine protease [Chitinophagaceae bacterium]|nr:MAG: rhomboid family intramembrane serine protease [Chitinophagaceae bacterium]